MIVIHNFWEHQLVWSFLHSCIFLIVFSLVMTILFVLLSTYFHFLDFIPAFLNFLQNHYHCYHHHHLSLIILFSYLLLSFSLWVPISCHTNHIDFLFPNLQNPYLLAWLICYWNHPHFGSRFEKSSIDYYLDFILDFVFAWKHSYQTNYCC